MKKDSDELHQLVSALTAAEKRYCSLYLKKHNARKDNRYLKLFNYLQKEREYNSVAVRKKMQYETKPNHYSVLKKQLYRQLLDGLHQFSLFTNYEEQLMRSVHQCALLTNKGLFAQAEKMLAHLQETARVLDFSIAQFRLQTLKLAIMTRKRFSNITDMDLSDWESHTKEILRELESTVRYRYLGCLVNKLQNDSISYSKEIVSQLKGILTLPEFTDEKKALTSSARLSYYNAKMTFYLHCKNPEKAMKWMGKNLQLLESNPRMLGFGGQYRMALQNYMVVSLQVKKYKLFESLLEKFRSIPKMSFSWNIEKESSEPIIFAVGFEMELYYLVLAGKFEEAYLKIEHIKGGLKKFGDRIIKMYRITMQYYMAYVCFALEKYNEALGHLMPLIQAWETGVADELQLPARMLQLLCHFEKGDKILLDSLIKSQQRSLLNQGTWAGVLRIVLTFIRSSLRKNAIEKKDWIDLQKKLQAPELAESEIVYKTFDYTVWARAHAEGISFSKAWAKGNKH